MNWERCHTRMFVKAKICIEIYSPVDILIVCRKQCLWGMIMKLRSKHWGVNLKMSVRSWKRSCIFKNPKYGIPWYDKLISCHNFYYYIYSLEYIAGRQAKGFVAVAVESDEWQAQRGPRSEFKTGWLVFQSICLCLSSNGCHIC